MKQRQKSTCCYIHTNPLNLFQEKTKYTYIKMGFGRQVSLRNRANKELNYRRNRNQVCGLCSHSENRLLGVLALVSAWSQPAFSYYRYQGFSRIEAMQALQFSNLELTNSQYISLKKHELLS